MATVMSILWVSQDHAFEKLFSWLRGNYEYQYSVNELLTEYLPESAELCFDKAFKK